MTINDMDDMQKRFLQTLFEQTEGDLRQAASMYSIGQMLDLDKDASVRTAEMLMGAALVEIRSLSGAIGLTEDGIQAAAALSGSEETSDAERQTLCRSIILDKESIRWVEQTVWDLKAQIGLYKSGYDLLTELIADVKTLDAQLMSPRPKTAIVREVLCSIRDQLENNDPKFSARIGNFLKG